MKRVLLLVAALFMVAGVAQAQDCDCDWEAVGDDPAWADGGYDWMDTYTWPFVDWGALVELEGVVGETVDVDHDGFQDMMHVMDADCAAVVGWDNGMWCGWDTFDPGTIAVPSDFYAGSPAFAETFEERHFGLYILMNDGWSEGTPVVICPAAAAAEYSASISGPHNVDPGDSVVLTVVTDGIDSPTYLWGDDSTAATLDLGVVDGGDSGLYTCTVGGEVDGEAIDPIEASFTLWVGVATPLAGGLGLGLLAGACALAGAVSIRRKK